MTMFTDVPLNGYKAGDIWHYREGQDWAGRNLLLYSENYSLFKRNLSGMVTTITTINVTEWDAVDAARFEVTGGTSVAKLLRSLGYAPDMVGTNYVVSMWIKNNGTTDVIFHSNRLAQKIRIAPGDSGRFDVSGRSLSTTSQLQVNISVDNANDPVDVTIWRPKVVNGNFLDDYQPAPEDLLPTGATEGYFIAGRDGDTFDFNDWAYYSQPIQNFSKLLWFAESIEI